MKLRIREMAVFAMLGTLMYVSKIIMEMLPNIHLVGILTLESRSSVSFDSDRYYDVLL